MQKHLVITLVGPDEVGIVDKVTKSVMEHDGNVEESRMARLGGEFVLLMLISIPEQQTEKVNAALSNFNSKNFQLFIKETSPEKSVKYDGWLPYSVTVSGADHEGIVNSITHHFSTKGINIESLDTSTDAAPMSGTLLFTMSAIIIVPPEVTYQSWRAPLDEVGDEMNVSVEVSPYRG